VDYLINNAGVAGAEQMAVDMDRRRLARDAEANLNSNYSLIEKVVPRMKAQGSGYILNVSSYFGGEKYIAVPYPNRADYAVSKAGQRALVENLARFVGPEIQINAIAPGPVEGQRLKGKDGKAGLFDRRAKLIANNKRLNQLHGAVMKSLEAGAAMDDVLEALAANDVGLLAHSATAPEPLRQLAAKIVAEAGGDDDEREFSCLRFLMTRAMALKLVARLANGCMFARAGVRARERLGGGAARAAGAVPRPGGLAGGGREDPQGRARHAAPEAHADRDRRRARDRVLHGGPRDLRRDLRALRRPAPGADHHRARAVRSAKPERVDRMEGETIWLIGEHLAEPIAAAARLFLAEAHVGSIMMLTRTAAAGEAIKGHARPRARPRPHELRGRRATTSRPASTRVPSRRQARGRDLDAVRAAAAGALRHRWQRAPRRGRVRELVEANLTHHFRVARKVSLFKGTRLILVSPDVPVGGTLAQFAMANFVKTTLHAFTATLGVENERLYAGVPVNQVNLTRRMRSEEPRDAAEQAEEYRASRTPCCSPPRRSSRPRRAATGRGSTAASRSPSSSVAGDRA
jgi:malonyl-CoA reductase / 3-hydroxypropionate dehydrogenase (NADP+)